MAKRTMAMQETPNDFESTIQTIQGAQIVTIKFGIGDKPSIIPDFIGQLCAMQPNGQTTCKMYVGVGFGPTDWEPVGVLDIPMYVAKTNEFNNFEVAEQSILGNQLVTIDSGKHAPMRAPHFEGEIYIDRTDEFLPHLYIAVNDNSGIAIWKSIIDMVEVEGAAMLEGPNNFENPRQTIMDKQIVSVTVSPDIPTTSPDYSGQLFMQPGETTADGKTKVWIADGNYSSKSWKLIYEGYSLPNTVVQTNKPNNFALTEQKLNDNQIMSFIDGGLNGVPNASTPLDYTGQMFISYTMDTSGPNTKYDIMSWIGLLDNGKKIWHPLQGGEGIPDDVIVRTDRENIFKEGLQWIENQNDVGHRSRITGMRKLKDGAQPSTEWPVMMGEMIYHPATKETTLPGDDVLVYVATGNRVGEWRELVQSSMKNYFSPIQHIGVAPDGKPSKRLSGVFEIVKMDTTPLGYIGNAEVVGEMAIVSRPLEGDDPSRVIRDVYISTHVDPATKHTEWEKVYDGAFPHNAKTNASNNFKARHQYLGEYNGDDYDTTNSYESIPGVRRVPLDPTGFIKPSRIGEIVIYEHAIGNVMHYEVYISVDFHKDAWVNIGNGERVEP